MSKNRNQQAQAEAEAAAAAQAQAAAEEAARQDAERQEAERLEAERLAAEEADQLRDAEAAHTEAELVTVYKDGEQLEVHPTTLKAHMAVGWRPKA